MAHSTKDYIPTEADNIAKAEAIKEYMRTHEDPRQEFIASYKIMSKQLTERVFAMNANDAAEIVKRNCRMVGWFPVDLTVISV